MSINKVFFILFLGVSLAGNGTHAQDITIPLFPEGIPCANDLETQVNTRGNEGRFITEVHEPEMVVYMPAPEKRNGAAVVICPGGGYYLLAWDKEGTKLGEWFKEMGVAAYVLKHRLPHWESAACRSHVALMDAQRAMRIVRSQAEENGIDPARIGIMGFSAGGHLASTASTHFDGGDSSAQLEVEQYSCRPDFSILIYPVITFDSSAVHKGSRKNLLGPSPNQSMMDYFSNEKQVTAETPPALLIHADDDGGVPPENSVLYYLALRRHGIPAAMHIYEKGGHGFGMGEGMGAVSKWVDVCRDWLVERGLLEEEE